jgi:hypothetical protein
MSPEEQQKAREKAQEKRGKRDKADSATADLQRGADAWGRSGAVGHALLN